MAKKKVVEDSQTNQPERPLYVEAVDRKRGIQERIKGLKAEIEGTSVDRNTKRQIAEAANLEVSRFKNSIGNGKDEMDDYEAHHLAELLEAAEIANNEERKTDQIYTELSDEINALGRELQEFDYCLELDDVLNYQSDLAAAKNNVSNIQALIAQQQQIIDEAVAGIPSLPDYCQIREDLLADIAIGKATDKDLATLGEKMDADKKDVTEAEERLDPVIEHAQLTIAGLQRKLEDAEKEVTTLEENEGEIVFQFLMAQAEREGEEYAALANQLIGKFKRLRAIDSILGHPPRLSFAYVGEFFIPSFNLKAFKGCENPSHPGQFGDARLSLNARESQAAREVLKQQYVDMGIELFK